jgi:uncharacterized membrane protein
MCRPWLLWRARRRATALLEGRRPVGVMLAGWGLFNLIEGLADRQLLGIHHSKVDADGDPVVVLDVAFLASGVLLLLVGSRLARSLNAYPVRWRAPR